MKRLSACALVLVAALAICVPAFAVVEDTPAGGAAIGSTVADFKLPDADGKERTLASLGGAKGTVLIFVSTQCPVSNAYNERMEKLSQELKARGLSVVGINSNVAETRDAIKSHAAEKGLSFAILKDEGNRVADRLGASVTPEAFLLDANKRLVYRGRIDNSRNGDSVTSSELREAVDAVLAGKPVAKSEVRAFGCSIKRAS
jgi:peroxiredoxin